MSEITDKRDNLIIFPATTTYLAEARVLLRSLLKNAPDIPVHITSKDGEADSLREFANVECVVDSPVLDSEFRRVRTYRFLHAAEMAHTYRTICLLDADMVVFRPLHHIFRMADTGTILVGCNNTILRYRKTDFEKMKVSAPHNIDKVFCTFCTVPLFINPAIHFDFLKGVFENPTGNDLEIPNLLAISMGLSDRLYYLPSNLFLNIHHSMLKPELGCIRNDQGLFSSQGEPIYILHGHWGDQNYVDQLIDPMIKNYGYYPEYIESAKERIKILKEEYDTFRQ